MKFDEAHSIVLAYGEMYGIRGLLETAEEMQRQYEEDNLSGMQRVAFRVFMREMGKLLAPVH